MNPPLITVDHITVRLRDRWFLDGLSWCIRAGEQWTLVGPNGAGKTTLAKAIAGLLPVVRGKIHYHAFGDLRPIQAIAYVASDARRDLWRSEQHLALSRDFAGRFTEATPVRALLGGRSVAPETTRASENQLTDVVRCCNLLQLLDKPLLDISTGEMSRVLVARELLRQPRMLVLDEPFEGLDMPGRQAMIGMLDGLAATGLPLLLIVHRLAELPTAMTHMLAIDDGRVVRSGPLDRAGQPPLCPEKGKPLKKYFPPLPNSTKPPSARPLIEMQAVSVRYGDHVVLDRLTWSVHEGQHWAITGPNGAGKSTLLKLVTGDCLQVYANAIRLFGRDRGTAQTLGETRRQLGVVSHDLAAAYQKPVCALDVVCSGFYDSVGLYRHVDAEKAATARQWLGRMGLSGLADQPFNQLSQGQRQMILIARAMVKSPRLLILDEPLSGLDALHRSRVLDLLEGIGEAQSITLVVISHHVEEIPRCTTHRLALDQGRVVACGPVSHGE